MTSRPVFRFAPSPNGELHLGHVLSAWVGHEMARRMGGRFLLRIEDIDQQRSRAHYETQIRDDLQWLGLEWEEPVWRQSDRFSVYAQAARQLRDQGLLYPCWATRRELDEAAAAKNSGADPDGVPLYPGLDKGMAPQDLAQRLASGEPYALRLDMERARAEVARRLAGADLTFVELDAALGQHVIRAAPERWGDAVIVRKDTPASYHLAVVIDDAAQGVTHVTRGQDLYAATDLHRMLQVLLDLPAPLYHHHPLLLDGEGRKLAKSNRSTSVRALRDSGHSALDVLRLAGAGDRALQNN